jgi:hypothetical protein
MSKTLLRHTLIKKKYFCHFCWLPYLYTFSLFENASFNIVSTETEYISTRSLYCLSSTKQLLIVLSVLHQTAKYKSVVMRSCLLEDRQYSEKLFGGGETIQWEGVWRTHNTMRSCLVEDTQYLFLQRRDIFRQDLCIVCPPPNSFSLYCLSSTKQLLIVLSVLHQTAVEDTIQWEAVWWRSGNTTRSCFVEIRQYNEKPLLHFCI